MMRKVWEIVSILAVANMLAMLLLILAMLATGGLDGNKAKLIRDVVMDRPLLPPAGPEAATVMGGRAITAGDRIADEQLQTQIRHLQIEQQMRELRDFQVQLDQAKSALDVRIAKFEQDRKRWLQQEENERALLASEGFKKSLELYESLSADQAKDLFMTMEDGEVVRFLRAMDPRKAAKIAKAFEAEHEKVKLRRILDTMQDLAAPAEPSQADEIAKLATRP